MPTAVPGKSDQHRRPQIRRESGEPSANSRGEFGSELTSFVGRRADLDRLTDLFSSDARLVTVLGPPGVGKTRLAKRFLSEVTGAVYFCDLRAARSVIELATELARVLDVRVGEGHARSGDEVAAVGRALPANGRCLIVLDNFEQLDGTAARAVGCWLRAAPDAHFVVTSRRVLGLEGEHIYDLAPLSLPAGASDGSSEAERLFFDRAQSAEPRWEPRGAEGEGVTELVKRLDGIPLAIELAAGQIRKLSVTEVIQQLEVSSIELASSHQDVEPRHATLRVAIDGSWQLLRSWERAALEQLSVFRGGFTRHAAEAVVHLGSGDSDGRPPVAEVIGKLREMSLLRVSDMSDPAGRRRWDMFEAIREYGAERLSLVDEEPVRDRHAAYYLVEGERWIAQLPTLLGSAARSLLSVELDNLRVAFARFARDGEEPDPSTIMRMALVVQSPLLHTAPAAAIGVLTTALDKTVGSSPRSAALSQLSARLLIARAEAFRHAGDLAVAEDDLSRAAERASDDERLSAEIDAEAGMLHHNRGRSHTSRVCLDRALARAQTLGALHLQGRIHCRLAWVLADCFQDSAAFGHYDHATALLHQAGDLREEAIVQVSRSAHQVFFERGDPRELLERQIDLAHRAGDRWLEATALFASAICYQDHGSCEQAQSRITRGVQLALKGGLQRVFAHATCWRGLILDERGDLTGALVAYRTSVEVAREIDEKRVEAFGLAFWGSLVARQGDPVRAGELLNRAERLAVWLEDAAVQSLVELQRGQAELARARRAVAAGDLTVAGRLHETVSPRKEVAKTASASSSLQANPQPLVRCMPEARAVLRLLERELELSAQDRPPLRVWPGAKAFQLGEQPRVELPRGPAIRAVLLALAEARVAEPGRPLSTDHLLGRGWPGEKMMSGAASVRIRDAIKRLRRAGLEPILLTSDAGYLLSPNSEVTMVIPVSAGGFAQPVLA